MTHELQWGAHAKSLRKLEEHGIEARASAGPKLTQWTVDYYECFIYLTDSRNNTAGGVGPIPLSEIKTYLDIHEITDIDERMYWVRMIRVLDHVYMEHTNKMLKREREKNSRTKSRAPRKR